MPCNTCAAPADTAPKAACQTCPITMGKGKKPVFEIDAKTVIDFESDFKHKLLCDGITFSLGSVCVYSCAFCYVIPMLVKQTAIQMVKRQASLLDRGLEDVVIRRRDALKVLRKQLTMNKPPGVNLQKRAVVFTSPLVDPAPNMDMAIETAAACRMMFELTALDVRILSKSNLLPKIAALIPDEFRHRLIFGVSTGTLDDVLANSFEIGTAHVSKRLASLHRLQDKGYRTYGMLCPILPQEDYDAYAEQALEAIRVDRCEHVWAEVINLRGDSFTATVEAMEKRGFLKEAERLRGVCGPGSTEAWEQYSRDTFEALAKRVPPEKLRFLQYVTDKSLDWWWPQQSRGAVLLGAAAGH